MVKKRTGKPHRCFRTNGFEICIPDFHKKPLTFNYSYSDGQQSCPIVSLENGGYTQSGAFKNQQVNLALSTVSWDHNYCRIFTTQIECPSRLGFSEFQGSLRLETASKHNQTFWISNSGPLCIQTAPSSSAVRSNEARSKQHSNRCSTTVLKMFPYAFPFFRLISQIPKKVRQEKEEQMIIVTPTWQTQSWYFFCERCQCNVHCCWDHCQIYC